MAGTIEAGVQQRLEYRRLEEHTWISRSFLTTYTSISVAATVDPESLQLLQLDLRVSSCLETLRWLSGPRHVYVTPCCLQLRQPGLIGGYMLLGDAGLVCLAVPAISSKTRECPGNLGSTDNQTNQTTSRPSRHLG